MYVFTAKYTGVSRDRIFEHGRVSINNFKDMAVYNLDTVPLGNTGRNTAVYLAVFKILTHFSDCSFIVLEKNY